MFIQTLSIIFSLVGIITIFHKNKDKIKKLKLNQHIGIIATYLATVAVATILIYYFGNWLVNKIQVEWIGNLISYSIIIIVLIGAITVMNKIISKIAPEDKSESML
ncbi:hypothetical protein [Saliterribacillus persicus]|uniref:Uncharacterized protein n=1 Tax=Saliterribacillus persicus TaxID=930114 RepID=A0A368X3Y0_9BACI|nr:hypothetical protein [Saliterribacillus persicus]RCW62515.1 hypothetical protein DFR57_1262 [Saliterribacillus persicus]